MPRHLTLPAAALLAVVALAVGAQAAIAAPPTLYVTSQSTSGVLRAQAIAGDGSLTNLGSRTLSSGSPSRMATTPDGRSLYVAQPDGIAQTSIRPAARSPRRPRRSWRCPRASPAWPSHPTGARPTPPRCRPPRC